MRVVRDDDVTPDYHGARELEQKGFYKEAAALYEKLLKAAPNSLRIINRLLIVYRKLKEVKKEIHYIDKAIAIQQQYFASRATPDKTITNISKKLNALLGHTDKKGKPVLVPAEVLKLQERKKRLLAKK